MISALLLICITGTTDCHVDVGKTFFNDIRSCQTRSQELIDMNNTNPLRSFEIVRYKCVDWEDKLV